MKLPKGWKECILGKLVSQPVSGVSVLGEDKQPEQGMPGVLRLSCVTKGRFNPVDVKCPLPSEISRLGVAAQRETILVSRSNTPSLVGASAFVPKDYPTAFLPDTLWLLRPHDPETVSMRWLSFMLLSAPYRLALQRIASGTSDSMKKIQKGAFLKLKTPTPPLTEQRKIADILTTWDEALEKLDALIEAQVRRKKAIMQQLLTGRRRLKGFSKPWKRFRFSELIEPQDRYVKFDDDHTYSLVSIRRRSGGVFFREALQGGDIKTKVMKRVHTGDFLISRMQVVHGALGMVRSECDGMFASDSYDVLVAKDAKLLHMPFLDWMSRLRSFWHLAYISSHGVHIEKMTFKLSDFMHEKITIPNDLEEQRQIAAILDTADQQLTILRNQRSALDQQKRGLMQRLLTGKVRVKIPKS